MNKEIIKIVYNIYGTWVIAEFMASVKMLLLLLLLLLRKIYDQALDVY